VARAPSRLDSRAIGLDVGLSFIRWLTGGEHLHYGLWTGLPPDAAHLGAAQEAYTRHLLARLPAGAGAPLRILDVGGGAGVTAAALLAAGHAVEIVVPSPLLAARCRANAPAARVHEMPFERFADADAPTPTGPFDVILFSESWQYIPQEVTLPACARLLPPGGTVLLADCFRSEAYRGVQRDQTVGGGHRLRAFRAALARHPFAVEIEEDLTDAVAPSVDIEQGLFNVVGHAVTRIDADLAAARPATRWLLARALRLALPERRRHRLRRRLMERHRTAEAFCRFNRYMLFRLRRT